MFDAEFFRHVMAAVIYAGLGLVVFAICFVIVLRLSPFSVRKEIEEDQNTSLAIIIGSMILGISIIVAAAILG